MGDDRILVILPPVLPDPGLLELSAAPAALIKRLRSFLPTDFLMWPTLRGHQGEAAGWNTHDDVTAYVQRLLLPQHHTVDLAGSIYSLLAVGNARSHTSVGFFMNAGTYAARGHSFLATTSDAILTMMSSPAQFMRVIMQGADEESIETAAHRADAVVDRSVLSWMSEHLPKDRDLAAEVRLDCPVLYLQSDMPVPGPPALRLEVLRTMAKDLRHDLISEWPLRMQEESGGHEVADKIIPFVKEVIAERESSGA